MRVPSRELVLKFSVELLTTILGEPLMSCLNSMQGTTISSRSSRRCSVFERNAQYIGSRTSDQTSTRLARERRSRAAASLQGHLRKLRRRNLFPEVPGVRRALQNYGRCSRHRLRRHTPRLSGSHRRAALEVGASCSGPRAPLRVPQKARSCGRDKPTGSPRLGRTERRRRGETIRRFLSRASRRTSECPFPRGQRNRCTSTEHRKSRDAPADRDANAASPSPTAATSAAAVIGCLSASGASSGLSLR